MKGLTVFALATLALATGAFVWTARLGEWHHFYLGIALAVVAAARRRPWLLVLGVLITVDDGWQHVRQVTEQAYASPLHRLYAAYLWPLPPVQWLTGRLDALLS